MRKRYTQTTLDSYVATLPSVPVWKEPDAVSEPVCAGKLAEYYTEIKQNIGDLELSEWPGEMCLCVRICGNGCRNRRRRIECSASTCGSTRLCTNRPWHSYCLTGIKLDVRATPKKGLGAFCTQTIEAGSLVCEYVGEVIEEVEKDKREVLRGNHYLMAYGSGKFIDAWQYGNVSRFINHSCKPNCSAEEWTVDRFYRIGIIASRRIDPGEEVTFDYGPMYHFATCKCAACCDPRE